MISTEDVGSLWFFSVLRTQDTKALFSIALKLHSMFKGVRYLFWAILALHLQARSPVTEAPDGKIDAEKALKLAEKMIIKTFSNATISQRTLEELLILIVTLQGTQNHADALQILESATGIAFPNEDERELVKGDLLEKNNMWDQAVSHVGGILTRRGIFDWNAWKLYIRSVDKCDQRDELVAGLSKFLEVLQPSTDKRSLMLARVDAGVVFGKSFTDDEGLVNSIVDYIKEFQDKGCCVPDMQHTSESLSETVLNMLVLYCAAKFPHDLTELAGNITWVRLERVFRLRLTKKNPDHPTTYSEDLSIDMIHRLLLEPGNVEEIDAERMAIAWMHLATLYIDRHADGDLLKAAGCGRKALNLASENFTIKMLLMLIYLRLGSVLLALDLFRSLEIKQLQLDTLAYLISDHLLELGDFEHAELFFHESFYIYDENRTQSWSLIAEAFSRGSYSNVPEFYEFARRLEYSMQAVACICGTIRTELMTKDLEMIASYLEGLKSDELLFDSEFMANLSDNRDRDVVDFVDHVGVIRVKVLNKLPTFGRASILIYTFIPILLRALLTDDSLQLSHTLTKFDGLLQLIQDHPKSAQEAERLEFVKSLMHAVSEYIKVEKAPQSLIDALAKLLPPSEVIVANFVPTYELLTSIQWELERDHWTGLFIACMMRGLGRKERRSAGSKAAALIQCLESKANIRKGLLEEASSHVSTLPCPNIISADQWTELTLSWTHSLTSYRTICDSSLAILRATSDSA